MNGLLSSEDKKRVEQKARELLWASYGDVYDLQPPIRLSKILPAIGLKLKFGKFEDATISGYFDRSDKVIYVSESEPYHRQVFTIAHELGHFILHEDRESDVFFRLDSIQVNHKGNMAHQEQEASWFATCLLLPKELLLLYWNVEKNTERLARIFEIAQPILEWRIKDVQARNQEPSGEDGSRKESGNYTVSNSSENNSSSSQNEPPAPGFLSPEV